jgi:hypothetical protein
MADGRLQPCGRDAETSRGLSSRHARRKRFQNPYSQIIAQGLSHHPPHSWGCCIGFERCSHLTIDSSISLAASEGSAKRCSAEGIMTIELGGG